jgi:hypothetical protein
MHHCITPVAALFPHCTAQQKQRLLGMPGGFWHSSHILNKLRSDCKTGEQPHSRGWLK